MNKKKVIIIIESFILGGAERVLVDIANQLDPQKFDITVCSIFKRSVYSSYQATIENPFKPHVHYKWLVNNDFKWLYRIFNYLLVRLPAFLYKLLVGDKYDVVVAFYEGAPTSFVANAKLKHGKKLTWLHTSTELSQKGKSIVALKQQEHYYSVFQKIIAVSEGVKQSFIQLFPSLKENVLVVHNPIDSETIIKKSKESIALLHPDCPLFVSVGRMTAVKGYDRYLRVINKLVKEGSKFEVWIIGGGERTEYEAYCKENRLENVRFLGNQNNPYPYMKIADWIVVPSFVEGLSTVVMEGLVLGKPILATDCPGMRELLGKSVIDNNEDSIEDGLRRILTGIQYQGQNLNNKSIQLYGIKYIGDIINA